MIPKINLLHFLLFAIYGLLGSCCLPKTRGYTWGVNHLNGAGLTVFFMDVRLMFECDICEDMELKIGLLAKRERKICIEQNEQ
jgi:hypothetical protein